MATNFDELVDSVTEPMEPPVPASGPVNSFDSLVDTVTAPDSTALHSSLYEAQTANPAAEAARRKQARALEIDPLLVTQDAQAQIRAKKLDPSAISADSPGTSKFLSKPANAKVAIDDVGPLQDLETIIRAVPGILSKVAPQFAGLEFFAKRGPDSRTVSEKFIDPLKSVAGGINIAAAGVVEGERLLEKYTPVGAVVSKAMEVLAPELAKTRRTALDVTENALVSGERYWQGEKSTDMQRRIEAFNKADIPEAVGMLATDPGLLVDQLSQSAIYLLPGAAAARGGATVSLTYNAVQEALDAAQGARQDAIRAGATAQEQDTAAAIAAVTTAPLAFLANKLAGTGLLESKFFTTGQTGHTLISSAIREWFSGAVEEGANTLGGNIGAATTYDPARDIRQGVAKSVVIGGLLESTHGVGMSSAEIALRNLSTTTVDLRTTRAAELQKAYNAEKAFSVLSEMTAKAAESETRKLDDGTFHEFVSTMVEDADTLQEVFVDAKTFAEALDANGFTLASLQQAMPAVAEQLQEALRNGSDVRISLPDYLTNIAPTPVAEAILPKMRAAADGLTYEESQAFYQAAKTQDEEAIQKLQAEATPVMTREEFEAQQATDLLAAAAPVADSVAEAIGPESTATIAEGLVNDPEAGQELQDALTAAAPITYEQYLKQHPNKKAVRARDINEVHNSIHAGLNALGRFPRHVNAAYAVPMREFYTQNADRMGLTASELYARLPVKFVAQKIFGEAFNQPEQNATLEDFGPTKIKDILTKHNWAIVTAENPNNTYTPDENAARMEQLRAYLDDNNVTYKEVDGFYDRAEKSVILLNVSSRQALDIGRLFNQESVLTRDGFVYQDGSVMPTTGEVFVHETAPDNYFTSIPDMGSMFTLGLDFDTRLSPTEHRLPDLEGAEVGTFSQTVEGGKLGEVTVTGSHFSRQQRDNLDGRKYGSGIRGAEADRVFSAKDSRIRSRLYFYVDEGKGVFPESGVGSFKHTVKLTNMYDGARNPQKFPKKNADGEVDFNLFETAVLNAGFDGYYIEAGFHRQGVAVMLGNATHGVRPQEASFAQMSEEDSDIESRFAEQLQDFDTAAEKYKALPDSFGGKVINTDVARELSPDYLADRTKSAAVHEPASKFTKDYYAAKLAEQPAEGEHPIVLFTAGGTGAGKTTGLKSLGDIMSRAQIVYDTNMNTYDSSKKKIEQALAAGKFVQIVLVQRDPVDALVNGAIPRAVRQKAAYGSGRTVPLSAHAATHLGAAETVARLRDEYRNNPRVRVDVIDNTNGPGGAKVVADITKMDYTDIHQKLRGALDEQYQQGRIPADLYAGFAEGDSGIQREGRAGDRGQSEQFYQSAQGWYFSQLARAIVGAKADNLPAGQWKAWLTANAGKFGVKKDEIQWTGLTDWLDLQTGKISKAQIADYLNTNGVQVEEVMLGASTEKPSAEEEYRRRTSGEAWNQPLEPTKFAAYVLPGGENYRELLLTLPAAGNPVLDRIAQDRFGVNYAALTDAGDRVLVKTEARREGADVSDVQTFRSAHFDQPNILAHVRFIERRDADGNRVLFLEELQSDWGQKGKKEGFDNEAVFQRLLDERDATPEGSPEREKLQRQIDDMQRTSGKGLPAAPFVTDTKSWTALALKRMIAYAVDNGFDKIAWTTGEQQAERYDLSKQVDAIQVWGDAAEGYYFQAHKDGRPIVGDKGKPMSESELAGAIGKDLADKAIKDIAAGYVAEYEGSDLKVGGEGMKGYYDKIVPQVANDVLKKIGAGPVSNVDIVRPNASRRDEILAELEAEDGIPRIRTSHLRQPGFAITEEMKAKVRDGLPLFQQNIGSFDPHSLTISLLNGANLSTVLHEGGHFYLRALELMAQMPEATPAIKADWQKVMDWFGTTSEQWAAMDIEQQRPYHEQWAQSNERWMLEGKAPSLEMQPIFSRFRSWLLSVYKSVEAFLQKNPLAGKLDDEIRGVFSRLIASEKAIEQAELARGYSVLPMAEGGDPAEYAKYLERHKAATGDAVETLTRRSIRDMRWVSNARSRAIRELQRQADTTRKAIKEEVTREVMAEPVNQARTWLTTGEMTDPATGEVVKATSGYKLNTEAVKAMYPETALGNPDLTKLKGLTSPTGLDPELIARMFGFTSGDQLVRSLIDAENVNDKIEGLTAQRMLEQHGELVDKRAIEEAADVAVHNEARARFMATGLKMLTNSPISSYQLARAAKEAAENAVSGKKVRDLRPGQYTAAETRASKQAMKLAPTDPKAAAEAQRTALLNNRLAQATFAVQDEIKKLLKYVSKFKNEGTRKSLDLDYLEQIDQLLAAFDPSPSTTLKELDARQSLQAWVAEQEALGFEPTIDPEKLAEMKRVSYKDMTVEELRGFVDSIKEIEHMGRMVKKMLTALDKREFQARIDEAVTSIEANANRTVKERGTPSDVAGMVSKFGRWWSAEHRKFASILREMDGGKDNGVMWNLLLRAMNRAGDQETEAKAAANRALTDLFAPIMADLAKATAVGNLYPKKTVVPGTDISMTLEQRIMFAMNWGNEGNRQRLLDGGITGRRGISSQEARAVLDTLSKEQWDFVQGVWDYIGTFRPQIEALERQLTGKTPEWVEPSPIQTRFGVYAGGYFPAKYDTALSTRSESLEAVTNLRLAMKGAYNSAATRNGYTKARAEAVKNRPLLLSFNAISQHVNEVIHRNAWQAWLVDATRVLRALDAPIREFYGAEINAELMKTVKGVAAGDAPAQNSAESFINRVRVGSTVVGMGWSISTALLQPSGLAQSWSRIGGKWLAKGVGRYVGNPYSATVEAMERSALLRDRNRGNLQRETNEILNVVRTGKNATALQASYFYLIGKLQSVVDIPTWWGAYEKGLAELNYELAADGDSRKQIEEHAAALADQAVLDSQSGGGLKDLASIQRGGPAQKLWTNFYSYFSATYNLNVEAYRRTNFKNPTEVGVYAADVVLLNIVPVLFSTALAVLAKGKCDWDDTECIIGQYAHEQTSYLFGQMILLREIGTGINVATGGPNYGYSGPAGIRFFSDVYKAFEQAGQGEIDMPFIKTALNVAGALAHFPAGQINRTLEGIVAIENGDVDGFEVVPAVVFGPPK